MIPWAGEPGRGAGVSRAIHVALEAHAGQVRRATDVPYVVHPIEVGLMLARLGAATEVIQAGLLHDVVEDSPHWSGERLEAEFGARVAGIVAELTEDKDLGWRERKEHGIRSVRELSPDALLVKACDKLHNLQSLLLSLEEAEDAARIWGAFRGRREGTLDVAARLVEALCERLALGANPGLAEALERVVERLHRH